MSFTLNLLKYIHNAERSFEATLEESIVHLKVLSSMSIYIPNNTDIWFKYKLQSLTCC